jgi:hypothetical protein
VHGAMRAMEPLIDTGFVFVSVRANKRHHHRQVVGEGEGKKRGGASPGMGGTWQRNCCRSRSSRSQMGTCAFCLAAPAAAIKGGLSPYRRAFCGESTHSRAVDVPAFAPAGRSCRPSTHTSVYRLPSLVSAMHNSLRPLTGTSTYSSYSSYSSLPTPPRSGTGGLPVLPRTKGERERGTV